jgi:hypothetical protein
MSPLDQLWTYVTENAAALGVVGTAMGVIIAFLAWWWPKRTDPPPSRNETVHGPKVGGDVGGDAVGRDKTAVQGDQVGRDQHIHGHKITAEQVIIQQSGEGAPKIAMSVASSFQLPARNPDFEGRRDNIEEIKAALRAGGAQVTALEGMGGIGKTDTAVEAVHDLVDEGRFEDAQLFLDLQGFSATAQPLAAADALRALLLPFVTPHETLPESEHDLAARFREETRGREILLFLDNVRDEAQIKPILPGHPGCAVLITSRNRLSLHGLMPIDLAAMDPAEATDLALRLANRRNPMRIGRTEAERIARFCGYLPLAIEVTANALSVSAGASVTSYLAKLEQRAKPLAALDRVKSTLELSLESLDATSRERWSALGVMPRAFERDAAKFIWRTNEPELTLEILEQRSLVAYEANTDTYHIHDVVQAIALDELSTTPHKKETLTQAYQN